MCQYSDGRREAKQWKCVGACDAKNLPAGTGQVAGGYCKVESGQELEQRGARRAMPLRSRLKT